MGFLQVLKTLSVVFHMTVCGRVSETRNHGVVFFEFLASEESTAGVHVADVGAWMSMDGLLVELMLGEEWLDRAVAAVLRRADMQRRCRSAAAIAKDGCARRRNGWHSRKYFLGNKVRDKRKINKILAEK